MHAVSAAVSVPHAHRQRRLRRWALVTYVAMPVRAGVRSYDAATLRGWVELVSRVAVQRPKTVLPPKRLKASNQ